MILLITDPFGPTTSPIFSGLILNETIFNEETFNETIDQPRFSNEDFAIQKGKPKP
jgi:hypothetical protein